MLEKLKNSVLNGYQITKEDAIKLVDVDLEDLCNAANELRNYFCGNSFDICTIINGKSGRCSEDCKYCAQSSHYKVSIEDYPLLSSEELLKGAKYN